MGMPALAMTDHGNVFGAYDFWKKAKAAGVKPIIGTEAYLTPGTHRSDKTRVRWDDGGDDDVSGGGAYTHMTMWAENTAGMHNLFRLSSLASLEGQYYKPRMDRELLQTYAQGLIATTGCPSGEVQTLLRIGRYDDARPVRGRVPRHLRRGQLLLRADGPRVADRAAGHGRPAAAGQGPRAAAGGHQRPALHVRRRTPRRTRCCCACSPARRWPTPSASSSRPTTSTSSRRRRCAAAVARAARGLRQHPAHRRALRGRLHRGRQPHAALPGAAGGVRGVLAGQGGRARPAPGATAGGVPREPPRAGRVRGRGHRPDGLPRLLPGRRRPGAATPRRTASGSARAAARPPAP